MRTITILMAVMAIATAAYAAPFNHLVYASDSQGLETFCDGLSGFDHTNVAAGPGGSMVWIRGEAALSLPEGMTELGSSYTGVFGDADALATYNSVFPPDGEGVPRPFGVFMGCEEEMGL